MKTRNIEYVQTLTDILQIYQTQGLTAKLSPSKKIGKGASTKLTPRQNSEEMTNWQWLIFFLKMITNYMIMSVFTEKNIVHVYTSVLNVFFQVLTGKWMLPS